MKANPFWSAVAPPVADDDWAYLLQWIRDAAKMIGQDPTIYTYHKASIGEDAHIDGPDGLYLYMDTRDLRVGLLGTIKKVPHFIIERVECTDPGVRTFRNGDPGYPPTYEPVEVLVTESLQVAIATLLTRWQHDRIHEWVGEEAMALEFTSDLTPGEIDQEILADIQREESPNGEMDKGAPQSAE